jgi:hypothetical protein
VDLRIQLPTQKRDEPLFVDRRRNSVQQIVYFDDTIERPQLPFVPNEKPQWSPDGAWLFASISRLAKDSLLDAYSPKLKSNRQSVKVAGISSFAVDVNNNRVFQFPDSLASVRWKPKL